MRNLINASFFLLLLLPACSQLAEEEKMQRAKQAHQAGDYDEALKYYQMLYNEHPKSPLRAEALNAEAAIQQNHRRDYLSAIQLYQKLADEYPNDQNAPGALFLVGFIYHNELKMLDSAKAAYEAFIQKYPNSEMIPSAQFELANLGKDPSEFIAQEKPKKAQAGTPARKR